MCVCVLSMCLTFCDPMNCTPPGSSVHQIVLAKILEWLTFPSPGDLPNPGIEPTYLAYSTLAGKLFTTVPPGVSAANTIWEFMWHW